MDADDLPAQLGRKPHRHPRRRAADPPAPQSGEPAAPPAERPDNPGLLNEIGKMLQKPWSTLKSPSETIDDLNARAKDAGATLSRITRPSSMVTGRMICPVSANGAPDCKAASDRLCQSKGYKEGKSLTTDSAESCSAKILVPGRTRKPDDCRTDNFVTQRAVPVIAGLAKAAIALSV